ncbi:MAG TPA: hypothetical protein VFM18_12220, partial [Methanosarcina sp.]|nr:hypothetical protein [Methanosarcina sp.]
KWMAYNAEFLEEEEIIRITNEQYVPVRKDDLGGKIDIDIEIATAEDNAAKAQELSFLLQTMGPNQDFEINKIIMADIARLTKMPDLAKKIEAHQPQPDPMQEQLKQLELMKAQLEIELIKANIHDKNARAGENEVDMRVKEAKAKLEEAKTRKLHSEADRVDLDFMKANDDYSEDPQATAEAEHQREMEIEMLKARLAELQRGHDANMQMSQQAHEKELANITRYAKQTGGR